MGQAKKRGTFEQRREEAESRVSFSPAGVQQDRPIRIPARKPGFALTMIMAWLVAGIKPRR
jgi:hypothetical protein